MIYDEEIIANNGKRHEQRNIQYAKPSRTNLFVCLTNSVNGAQSEKGVEFGFWKMTNIFVFKTERQQGKQANNLKGKATKPQQNEEESPRKMEMSTIFEIHGKAVGTFAKRVCL